MSLEDSFRPRRSVLYMPSSNERALEKAQSIPADALILDLEDAVAPDAKPEARERVCAAATSGAYGHREVAIRANGIGTPWHADDLQAIAKAGPAAVVIPKINRAADVQNRRFSLRVRLENVDEAVRPGMFARLTLVTRSTDAPVAVPLDAVNEARGKTSVTVIGENDEARTREVKTGARDGGFVEITEGVKAGERVVTLSYNPVKDGQKVSLGKPKEKEPGGRK